MSFTNNFNNKNNQLGPKTYEATEGLDDFIKDLERYFFASAKLTCKQDVQNHRLDLVVDLHFNFSIADCLSFFNDGDWKGYSISEESSSDMANAMSNAIKKLNQQSTYPVDIMETSLHFTDISIIVSRLYPQSIPEHIGRILTTVSQHFVYFTKGLTDMPYEVFVPVFEHRSVSNTEHSKIYKECGYYDYWGLYFDEGSDQGAYIYSLDKKKLYEESIFLFE